ncbi:trimeric intracellular cation channel family protein [Arthrobacter echini]|uniref:Trimeric intracellular cation channel family protein n=1 Tax=Arthrobacter echini TaxID=1529066 RepID=A0A4S5E4X1_9MICC|nr:TRIC cation channel family protein [Arthrobacter echini]THJ66527.1 trimeric intracellular cation channel family protein [Arthrobacter echini]
MDTASQIALAADLLGVLFFAVSGSLLAARKSFDLVGSLLLAALASLGGGVLRDVILDVPPAAFNNPAYLVPPLLATGLVYFVFSGVERVRQVLVLFDAAGLALFCITGTVKALELGQNPVSAVLLGVATAVGGGLLRDVVANEIPQLFDPRDIYALPAMLGASMVTVLYLTGTFTIITGIIAASLAFSLRILAWRYSWHAPLAAKLRDARS